MNLCYQEGLQKHIKKIAQSLPASQFGKDKPRLVSSKDSDLRSAMEKSGPKLAEYVGGKIYYGIKTGLNKAFIIDRETRDRLVQEDPKSSEILQPLLVGDDVRKYEIHFRESYLIWTYIDVPIEKYPAILSHLQKHQEKAEKRCDQGNHWWELRHCDYYEMFGSPKIVYPEIAKESRFLMDTQGYY